MAQYFDSWRTAADDVVLQSDWQRHCPYSPQSAVLSIPGHASQQTVLPLFGGVTVGGSGEGPWDEAAARDLLLHAGGPVWALDWCPASVQLPPPSRAGGASSSGGGGGRGVAPPVAEYLAVGCHPCHSTHHSLGAAVTGPAVLQVWEVRAPGQAAAGLGPPRMALAVAHDGGLAWQCRWCPAPALADSATERRPDGALPRLGLLAAALGDGSVRVWAVPQPSWVQRPGGGEEAPLVAQLPVVASITSEHLGGSMPCLIDWLPSEPHDLLLIGCWDGTVALARLLALASCASPAADAGGGGGCGGGAGAPLGMELLLHFPAEALPLRALRWAPPAACGDTADLASRHLFLTAGHEGSFRIWDWRDEYEPVHTMGLSTSTVLGAAWTSAPLGVLAAVEDASLRGCPLSSWHLSRLRDGTKANLTITWRGRGMGALWAVEVQPSMQLAAYAGEDGQVGLFPVEYEPSRKRSGHVPYAGLEKREAALRVMAAGELEARCAVSGDGKAVERSEKKLKAARFPDESEALYRLAWGAAAGAEGAWLASAGAAGLVRVQRVAPAAEL